MKGLYLHCRHLMTLAGNNFFVYCGLVLRETKGNIVQTVLMIIFGVFILGTIIPVIWDNMVGTDTAIQALTGTDDGTTMLQTMWPIMLTIVGIAIAAGVIFWALRKFNVLT